MKEYKERLLVELNELRDRKNKLYEAITKEGFEEKVGTKQFYLMRWQYSTMLSYYNVLVERCADLDIIPYPYTC